MRQIDKKVMSQPSITVDEFAEFEEIGRNGAYDLVRQGEVEVIRRGKLIRVLCVPLCRKHHMKSEIAA